jgi:serine/threonine-protein kinase
VSSDEPRRIGHFTVLSTLGRGATGEVVRARDSRLGREVAIKTVRNLFGIDTIQFRGRFEAEARALAALSHPAIVQIYEIGFEADEPYLVMELVDGPSLREVLAERDRLSDGETRSLGIQLARALDAAHARGILHRDVKPANVLRAPDGQWKLADFGIARLPDSATTLVGQFLGTPAFAAPETLARGEATTASDVFALAVTLAEAASGERVRGDASFDELIESADQPVALPASLAPGLARALAPAVALAPRDRPTAAALAELLARGDDATNLTAVAPTIAAPAPDRARPIAKAGPATRDLRGGAASTRAPSPAPVDDAPIAGPPPARTGRILAIGAAVALAAGGAVVVMMRTGAATPPDAAPADAPVLAPGIAPGIAIDARAPYAPPPPDAPAPPDAAPGPKVVHVPQARGNERIVLPAAGLSIDAIAAWNELARLIADQRYRRARTDLDAFEAQFGATSESQALRDALADAPPDRAGWPP